MHQVDYLNMLQGQISKRKCATVEKNKIFHGLFQQQYFVNVVRGYLEFSELCSSCCVCKAWADISGVEVCLDEGIIDHVIRTYTPPNKIGKIVSICTFANNELQWIQRKNLIQSHAGTLRSLQLAFGYNFPNPSKVTVCSFPELRTVHIDLQCQNKDGKQMNKFFDHFVHRIPNVRSLSFETFSTEYVLDLEKLRNLEQLNSCESPRLSFINSKYSRIDRMKIAANYNRQPWSNLADATLKLSLVEGGEIVTDKILRTLLAAVKDPSVRLKELEFEAAKPFSLIRCTCDSVAVLKDSARKYHGIKGKEEILLSKSFFGVPTQYSAFRILSEFYEKLEFQESASQRGIAMLLFVGVIEFRDGVFFFKKPRDERQRRSSSVL